MDTKRLILALVLSFAVFFGWQMLFPMQKPAPATETAQTTQQAQPAAQTAAQTGQATGQAQTTAAPAPGDIVPTQGKTVSVTTPLFTADFTTQGGLLEAFKLAKYKKTVDGEEAMDMVGGDHAMGLFLNGADTWSNAQWDENVADVNVENGEGSIIFTGRVNGYAIERTLTFTADNYLIKESVRVISEDVTADNVSLGFSVGTNSLSNDSNMYNRTQLAWFGPDGQDEETDRDDLRTEGLEPLTGLTWAAVDNNYFLLAVLPEGKTVTTGGVEGEDVFFVRVTAESPSVRPGDVKTFSADYFLGPKDRELVAQASPVLAPAVDFGWFDFIAKPLLLFLVWINQYVGNYGIAIILLTIIIKIIFWPLSQKSYKSMEQMKKIQPMVQKLREKYKGDKQRMNQETMQLYKTYKVNPAGGCLPMLVQIPVFFGLYRALLGAIELRHASFIDTLPFTDMPWLADMSSKDPYYITPIIMGATMVLQQLMSPSTGDPTQRKMMMLMPVVFTFLFLNFPAGLVVYWLCNNVLSIAQQYLIMKGKTKKTA